MTGEPTHTESKVNNSIVCPSYWKTIYFCGLMIFVVSLVMMISYFSWSLSILQYRANGYFRKHGQPSNLEIWENYAWKFVLKASRKWSNYPRCFIASTTNQQLFEKHLCNQSSYYEKYGNFFLLWKEAIRCKHRIYTFCC